MERCFPCPPTVLSRGAARPSSPPATATAAGRSSPPAPAAAAGRSSPPLPASGAAGAGHGHVLGGSASVLAAGADRGRRPLPPAAASGCCRSRPSARWCRRPSRWRPLRPRPARSLASLLWTSSSPRSSPQVASAAATSESALQASKLYRGGAQAAGSISNTSNDATWKMNRYLSTVPLQRGNR